VVPETVLFVRRKDVSEMTIQAASRRTVHYTELLDFDFIRTINTIPYQSPPTKEASHSPNSNLFTFGKKSAKKLYGMSQNIPLLAKVSSEIKEKEVYKLFHPSEMQNTRFPDWLTEEWRNIHSIDKSIYPDNDLLK